MASTEATTALVVDVEKGGGPKRQERLASGERNSDTHATKRFEGKRRILYMIYIFIAPSETGDVNAVQRIRPIGGGTATGTCARHDSCGSNRLVWRRTLLPQGRQH